MSKLTNTVRSKKYIESFLYSFKYKESVEGGIRFFLKWSSVGVLTLMISPLVDFYLKNRGEKMKNNLVFETMEYGSRPRVPVE